jgi:protein gp37
MAENSKIEWTDVTWNPTTGCTRASAGCDNCYAFGMTKRLAAMGQKKYQGLAGKTHFNGVLKTHDDELQKPLRWKKPRMVFVNSMSDLFHKDVPFEFIDKVFCVMNATKFTLPISQRSKNWHTYQVLTKRPDRMAEYMLSRAQKFAHGEHPIFKVRGEAMRGSGAEPMNAAAVLQWPPDNIWLGTSVENQQAADERIPHLLRCPAAVRFLSCEPLLGPVNLEVPWEGEQTSPTLQIDWVIVGGESGHNARPTHPDWARSIRDQCEAAGVPFFFKQWGEWAPLEVCAEPAASWTPCGVDRIHIFDDHETVFRIGKKAAGRRLDGREWNEFPAAATAAASN